MQALSGLMQTSASLHCICPPTDNSKAPFKMLSHLGLRPLIRERKQEFTCFYPASRTNDSKQKMVPKKCKFTLIEIEKN